MYKKVGLLLILGLAAGSQTYAATESSTIRAEIAARVITLTNNRSLNFGEILPFSVAGFVQVNANTTNLTVSNAQVVDATDIASSNWTVDGAPNGPFSIVLPGNDSVSITNGTSAMSLTFFHHNAGNTPRLSATGTDSFNVGARLLVGGSQPPGVYTGTFNVTVSYL